MTVEAITGCTTYAASELSFLFNVQRKILKEGLSWIDEHQVWRRAIFSQDKNYTQMLAFLRTRDMARGFHEASLVFKDSYDSLGRNMVRYARNAFEVDKFHPAAEILVAHILWANAGREIPNIELTRVQKFRERLFDEALSLAEILDIRVGGSVDSERARQITDLTIFEYILRGLITIDSGQKKNKCNLVYSTVPSLVC